MQTANCRKCGVKRYVTDDGYCIVCSRPSANPEPRPTIDTLNRFVVSAPAQGNSVTILFPPAPGQLLTKDQALNLAAYLVTCSLSDLDDFRRVYDAITNA